MLEYQLRSDRDSRFQRAIDRTLVGIETVDPDCGFPLRLLGFKPQDDVGAADHKHVVL